MGLVAGDATTGKAAEAALEEKGAGASGRAVKRRADECPKLASAFAKYVEARGGDAVSVDEKRFKPRGESRWAAGTARENSFHRGRRVPAGQAEPQRHRPDSGSQERAGAVAHDADQRRAAGVQGAKRL